MAKPISFGHFQFRTKKSATEEARRRINQYEAGDKLNPDDELFFSMLFTLHSEYEEKRGSGIDYIQVERDFHNNRCLYIHRTDGTRVDCSWVHCIQPASRKQVVSMAFRRAVKERIIEFKNSNLSEVMTCPELGILLSFDNSHVAYSEPSFDHLLSHFLSQNGLSYEDIELTNPKPIDTDQRGILSDSELAVRWDEFHRYNASLTLLSAEANLRRLKS
ncbi:DUF3223 domain-containing protein [Photobacterium leiognathi]|uniref:DUF3223 domain-containing protein n=1 Tax=Photobacterium leiognathi TaxID=553611 RepID=UPI00298209F6|nr:DUF3223 domain-containing protein [Photobacterium leiognathi]